MDPIRAGRIIIRIWPCKSTGSGAHLRVTRRITYPQRRSQWTSVYLIGGTRRRLRLRVRARRFLILIIIIAPVTKWRRAALALKEDVKDGKLSWLRRLALRLTHILLYHKEYKQVISQLSHYNLLSFLLINLLILLVLINGFHYSAPIVQFS